MLKNFFFEKEVLQLLFLNRKYQFLKKSRLNKSYLFSTSCFSSQQVVLNTSFPIPVINSQQVVLQKFVLSSTQVCSSTQMFVLPHKCFFFYINVSSSTQMFLLHISVSSSTQMFVLPHKFFFFHISVSSSIQVSFVLPHKCYLFFHTSVICSFT